jgi:predicted dehydrogenase
VSSLSASPPARTVSWAIAGYGKSGSTYHAPLISHGSVLSLGAVVGRGAGQARARAARDLPGAEVVSDLESLVARGIEGVTIATPPGSHVTLALEALNLGLAVVVDKPFGVNVDEARRLEARARDLDGVLVPI